MNSGPTDPFPSGEHASGRDEAPEVSNEKPPGRFTAWARVYRTPLSLSFFFVGVVGVLFVVSSLQGPERTQVRPASTSTPAPTTTERCGALLGACAPASTEPPACVEGSHYDQGEGFCMPDATAKPTAAPVATLVPNRPFQPMPTPRTIGGFPWFVTPEPRDPSAPAQP